MRTRIDLSGQRFGRLIAKGRSNSHRHMWICACDCGGWREVYAYSLKFGHTRSCGCLGREARREQLCGQTAVNRVNLEGKKFGRLLVMSVDKTVRKNLYWTCKCDCGLVVRVAGTDLRNGHTKSCGCFMRDVMIRRNFRHGYAVRDVRPAEYGVWQDIKKRCSNERSFWYERYGGRGITICDRWAESFAVFYADMGPRLSNKHSIDRIDNDGNYCPENCRWATRAEQARNRCTTINLTFNGVTRCMSDWARHLGVHLSTIQARFREGKPIHLILAPRAPRRIPRITCLAVDVPREQQPPLQ